MAYSKRDCSDCGASFEPYQYNQKRCGNCVAALGGKYKGKAPRKECPSCGEYFIRRTPRQTYCSSECGGTQRHGHLKSTFGITKVEYDKMLEECGGVCSICGEEETFKLNGKIVNLSVDHDHTTGKIRGLLCRSCNLGLGNFKDNIQSLERAIKYLKGSETISRESTPKRVEAHDTPKSDDIVRPCGKP